MLDDTKVHAKRERYVLCKWDGDKEPEKLPVEIVVSVYENSIPVSSVNLKDPEEIKQFALENPSDVW